MFSLSQHDLGSLLHNTLVVAVISTTLALVIGLPAAHVLARQEFRLKSILTALYLLPMLVPPLVYGIPLAILLLRYLDGGLLSVIIINVVPVLPFVILILRPFIEQVEVSLESASRMLGASRLQTFQRVLLPLLIPGVLTAGVLAIVRVVAMFDLTYLVADASSQTLVVSLYGDAIRIGHQSPSGHRRIGGDLDANHDGALGHSADLRQAHTVRRLRQYGQIG